MYRLLSYSLRSPKIISHSKISPLRHLKYHSRLIYLNPQKNNKTGNNPSDFHLLIRGQLSLIHIFSGESEARSPPSPESIPLQQIQTPPTEKCTPQLNGDRGITAPSMEVEQSAQLWIQNNHVKMILKGAIWIKPKHNITLYFPPFWTNNCTLYILDQSECLKKYRLIKIHNVTCRSKSGSIYW